MTKTRNPKTDYLLTPENSALILIDYQPGLVDEVHSVSREVLVNNAVAMAKTGKLFDMPIILSTIAVAGGFQKDTIPEVKNALPDIQTIDRQNVNAWEEEAFVKAVKATGRKKFIMAGLWTEVCLAFPVLDMLREGYEIYALSDVSGGTTIDAHERAMQRMIQAGAVPVTWEAVLAELGRLNKGGYDFSEFIDIMNSHLPASIPVAQRK